MPEKIIDISQFGAFLKRKAGTSAVPLATPAVRFAQAGEPVAAADTRTIAFVFSDDSVDRYGDTIDARGWVLENYNNNPVALFGHDAASVENVIGRAKNVRIQGSRLVGDIEFMEASVNPNADAVFQMVKGGFLKTVSVGFQPLDWKLSKDKSRNGGVDFVKQELLEISIVPIPANPKALVQARAAGIEVERLGLKVPEPADPIRRVAPPMTKKGMYSLAFLASILADLGYLQESAALESEMEGDDSPIPGQLLEALKNLGQILIDMTIEEVGELLASKEPEDDADDVMALMAPPAARRAAFETFRKLDDGAVVSLTHAMRSHLKGERVQFTVKGAAVPLSKAGKTISAANAKMLRAAHDDITKACGSIMLIIEPDEPDEDDNQEKQAARRRKAVALAAQAIAQ